MNLPQVSPDSLSAEQKEQLVKLRNYHFQMSGYITSILNGTSGNEPRRPNLSIKKILNPPPIINKLENLSDTLKKHLLDETVSGSEIIPWENLIELGADNPNLAEALKNIHQVIERKQCISDHLRFGEFLETLYFVFKHERLTGKIKETWSDFLKQADLTTQTTHMYRTMFNLLKNHRKFFKLNISFTFLYQKRHEIEVLLKNTDESSFWQQS